MNHTGCGDALTFLLNTFVFFRETSTGCTPVTFSKDVSVPLRMNCNNSGYLSLSISISLALAASPGQNFNWSNTSDHDKISTDQKHEQWRQ